MENKYLEIFFLSMAPITELRLSIPLGVIEHSIDWLSVFIICILGNFIICIPILYTLNYFDKMAKNIPFLNKILDKIYSRTRSKANVVDKYNYLGVILFVGIPLPFTGAWTGCVASHLFGLERKKTLIAIIVGLSMSATIVTLIIFFAQNLLSWIGYQTIN